MKKRDKLAVSAPIGVVELLSLYDEAKEILTEAADYFSGPGFPNKLSLNGEAAAAYTEASKCITTRLMEIMAWLFIQRAVLLGEVSQEEAAEGDARFNLVMTPLYNPQDPKYYFPDQFCDLEHRCGALFDKIRQINQLATLPQAEMKH